MKNLFFILFIILIVGCHGTKKVTKSRVIAATTTEVKESTAAQLLISIDTTKLSDTETTYRKTEYYPPAADSMKQGPVKSVETLTVKKRSESKGKTEAVKSEITAKTTEVKETTATKTKQAEKPAPDPKRWMWIFGILTLLTGLVVYLRNSPVIKSVLSFARKFINSL